MTKPLDALAEQLLSAAKAAGADAADTLVARGTSVSIEVRGGTLEQAERSEGLDLGLRVFVGKRVAIVSVSDSSDRTISEMAERAVAMAHEAPEDPYVGLADPAQLTTGFDVDALELADPAPEPSAEHLQDDACAAEAAALGQSGGIAGAGRQCRVWRARCVPCRKQRICRRIQADGPWPVLRGDCRHRHRDGTGL